MKAKLSVAATVFFGIVSLTGCQPGNAIIDSSRTETTDEKEADWKTISFSQNMDGYSINTSIPVCRNENGSYDVDISEDMVFVQDDNGNTVSSMALNNPWLGGTRPGTYIINFIFEPIAFSSGNLLFVGIPVKNAVTSHCFSIYYFDDSFVNYIGYTENGGDFFPLATGPIVTDGDTFTLSEIDMDGNISDMTYKVDFDKKIVSPN